MAIDQKQRPESVAETALDPDTMGTPVPMRPVPMRPVPDTTGPAGTVTGPTLAGTLDAPRDLGAVTKTQVEATQGIQTGRMRWVLGISMLLVIVAMFLIYLFVR
jgi:hypothetical protein